MLNFKELLKTVHQEIFKPAHFKKEGQNFRRKLGQVFQIVNFQKSSTSSNPSIFYVNIGVAFDEVALLLNQEIPINFKEYACDNFGFRHRLENLNVESPSFWKTEELSHSVEKIEQFKNSLSSVINELSQISSIESYKNHKWFSLNSPSSIAAQSFYILNDLNACHNEVISLTQKFSDRKNACREEFWVKKLGLMRLKQNCNE